LRHLALSIPMALATTFAASAECSKLNTAAFLEQTQWEQVIACVKAYPELVSKTDSRGYNLLMTAVGASIRPFALDEIFRALPEELRDDIVEAIDRQGRSLGHIAAAEGKDPAIIFVLSANDVPLNKSIDADENAVLAGSTPLHLATERDDGWLFVAALLTTGADLDEDERGITPFDLALGKDPLGPEALLLAREAWPVTFNEQRDPVERAIEPMCDGLLTANFLSRAEVADVVACLQNENQLLAVDRNGNSLLHLAAAHASDPWIIDWILAAAEDHGSLLEKRNSAGKSPLHLVAEEGRSAEVLLHLLAWGAKPDTLYRPESGIARKDRGTSALHMAASRKDELRKPMILILLAFEADTMLQESGAGDLGSETGGRTALHRALLAPDPIVLLVLLRGQFLQESNVGSFIRRLTEGRLTGKLVKQIYDDSGRTALHMAASRPSDLESLLLLVTYGFSVDSKDNQSITPLMFAAQYFTDADNFLYLLEQSGAPCGTSTTGATVEAALRSNKALMPVGSDDASGQTLSPLAIFKQRCPG
jgi:ankyrin repeat protein